MTTAHEPQAPAEPATSQRSMADLVRAAVSGWLGTALEFMDFQLYSLAAALVFSQLFFSGESPGMAVVLSMATYGVGYIARPLGAVFFGRLGDRIGRRKVLFYTIALMGAATTLIGVLPTYHQVGMLAPILLVALRLLQGFGAGAEISGAGVMLAEYAPAQRRGFVASLVGLGTNCGTLFASAIWAILLGVLVESDVIAWGWRIPFIASAVVMVFAVWIRLNLKESPVFEEREDVIDGRALSRAEIVDRATRGADTRTLEAIERKPVKALLVSFFLRFGQAGNSGLIQTYLISFMTLTLALQKSVSANAVIVSSIVGFLTIPTIGWLGDRFGRRRMYIIVMSAALVVIVPTMLAIDSKNLLWVFVGYVVLHNVAVLSPASLENVSIPEIFGARNRYTLTAVVREIAAVIATGIGPVVAAAWVAAATGSPIPIMVMMGLYSLSALIVAVWAKDWTGRDLTDPRAAM
ncbi:permease of the major facilitator superfamily [Mycolicibacterium canariasense]|uniref:Permease of the major facilitator superfamily n=1 Tax=Mycolicibacterium canariasense TaxID=228230 RepID=A0A100WI48_MYCCR|nr:MFS transporter [Mycolicibacterium canariasense]MCV7208299.1 MFS transporter [Mycolicibacterium canariasense]ORV09585.1 MFS transporter [Mycolicibacterium canariasense]GAS98954.1 permease of the major facilitator superfamily [Mycolicibacterium canariasense]